MSAKKDRAVIGSITLAFALFASACGGADVDVTAAAASGDPDAGAGTEEAGDFPQFSAATIEGAQLDFGSLEGQDALLWFWAPW